MKANAANSKLEKMKMRKEDSTNTKPTDSSQEQLDPVLKQKIQQLMDMTQCTQDNAIFALHDSDNDVNMAVNMLLESGNDMQGEWQEQKGKNKKKQVIQTKTEEVDTVVTKDSNNDTTEAVKDNRSYPRNAPPRFQRGGSRRQDFKSRDNDSFENSEGSGRRFGGERGRGRSRGRGRGGSRHMGGDRNRGGFGRSNDNSEPQDGGSAIGTWTSEADADPKTDSWGDVWGEEDNQWTGDLKSTHVFESSAKTADTFPTPTEFDPSAVAAQPTANMNGSAQTNLDVDTSFPKQQVETLKPSSTALYDNQLASESIKNAIGIPSQSHSSDKKLQNSVQSSQGMSVSSTLTQAKNMKQLRSKVPPPSTKIPTAPVEMPHNAASMVKLGVQFGAMDFSADAGLTFESSSLSSSFPASSSERSTASSSMLQGTNSLYATSQPTESIPYHGSTGQSNHGSSSGPQKSQTKDGMTSIQSDMYNSQMSQHNSMYNSNTSSPYKNTTGPQQGQVITQTQQSTSTSANSSQQQPFQSNNRTLSSANYYNMSDGRSKGGNYHTPNQTNSSSLYTATDPQYNQYGVPSGPTAQSTSLGSTQSSQPHPSQSNSSSRLSAGQLSGTKPPPNLPPPPTQPLMGVPNYMIGPGGMPYYNQPMYNVEDLQKLPYGTFYDLSQYNMSTSSIGSFSGTGSGDGKMARMDAQSPTVQGAQNQSQNQQSTSAASVQAHQQQFMSIPPGYPGYYYTPNNMMPGHYNIYQMPSATQNITIPGTNTTGGYQSQKSATAVSNSYYSGSTGYDDVTHSGDFNKGVYGGSKQPTNLASGSGSSSELSSMYKSNNQGVSTAVYGGNPSGYISAGHTAHMMPQQQHIIQSAETGMGGRSSQTALGGKPHSKQYYNWNN